MTVLNGNAFSRYNKQSALFYNCLMGNPGSITTTSYRDANTLNVSTVDGGWMKKPSFRYLIGNKVVILLSPFLLLSVCIHLSCI